MNKKRWLQRAYFINQEINTLIEEKQAAFARACSITVPTDKEHFSSSGDNSTEKKFIRYTEYEIMIDKRIDKLLKIKKQILNAINDINTEKLRILLVKRYLQFKTWERIAIEMNYDVRQIYRLHQQALKEIKTKKRD